MSWTFTVTSDENEHLCKIDGREQDPDTIGMTNNQIALYYWKKKGNTRTPLDLYMATEEDINNVPDTVEWLDITCSDVEYISKYPKNLRVLICRACLFLKEIRDLPQTIEYINCSCSRLLQYIILPEGVTPKIKCKDTTRLQLQSKEYMEENISDKVQYRINKWVKDNKPTKVLDLSYLNLTSIPELPDTIERLKLGGNPITELNNLPTNLKYLECQGTNIKNLDNLPKHITYINCAYSTSLESIDNLPNSIKKIHVTASKYLKKISTLPSSLRELCIIGCNSLEEMCNLPHNLRVIVIIQTAITILPLLPESIRKLCILENNIKEITYLPSNIKYLHVDYIELPNNIPGDRIHNLSINKTYNIPEPMLYLNVKDHIYKNYNKEIDPTDLDIEEHTSYQYKLSNMSFYYAPFSDDDE